MKGRIRGIVSYVEANNSGLGGLEAEIELRSFAERQSVCSLRDPQKKGSVVVKLSR